MATGLRLGRPHTLKRSLLTPEELPLSFGNTLTTDQT